MNKNIKPYSVETLISEKEIKNRINELGKDVNQFYRDTKKLLVVGLLRGSFVFIADLVRELNIPVEVDFMTASSYGNSMQSSNNIRILTDLNTDIKNLDVLLVEDIIDTGHTLNQVIKLLKSRKPKSARLKANVSYGSAQPSSDQSVIFHYACPNCSAKLQPPTSPNAGQNCLSCGWDSHQI